MVTRTDILQYAEENYHTKPEYLWAKSPNYAVLRHSRNRKWYALVMDVPLSLLSLNNMATPDEDQVIDILDIKCEPDMILALSTQEGFCPAYHMNKKHWLTVILDGTVADDEIYNLLDISYEMTK